MAAELCRVPFQDSYCHPIILSGFAAYICKQLGGIHPFIANTDKIPFKPSCLFHGADLGAFACRYIN